MTLLELSALYDESATRIRVRMAQLRADAKEQTDPAAAQALRQRIAELTPLLREMRELRRLTEGYYTRPRDGTYTAAFWYAPRRDSLE